MDSINLYIKNIIKKDTIIFQKDTVINTTNLNIPDYSIYLIILLIILISLLILIFFKKEQITNNFYINSSDFNELKEPKTNNIKKENNIEDIKSYLKINKIEETNL